MGSLQLLPQMADMNVDEALRGGEFAPAEIAGELIPGNDVTGGVHENVENIKLDGCDIDAVLALPDLAAARIEADAADLHGRRSGGGDLADPAQNRPHPGQQLVRREGHGDIVDGAGIEAGDAIAVRGARGQQDDRRLDLLIAEALQDFEPIEDREHDIDETHPVAVGQCAGQASHCMENRAKAEIVRRAKLAHHTTALGVVVDQENRPRIAPGIGRLAVQVKVNAAGSLFYALLTKLY